MEIVIIGSGNVATVLGRKFKTAGHSIVQIYSRNARAASELAYEWDTESTNYISLINRNADLYLVAVSDDAIADVIREIKIPGKIIVHTAASVPMEILKTASENYGVFYPLQSLSADINSSPAIPIFLDASNVATKRKLEQLAFSIKSGDVVSAGNEDRLHLHVAAVLVSNFTNQCMRT